MGLLRRTVIIICISFVFSCVAMPLLHWLPLFMDDFLVVHENGVYHKVFRHGWPLQYASEGMAAEPLRSVFLKISANLIGVTVIVSSLALAVNAVFKKHK